MRNNPDAPLITGDLARVVVEYEGLSGKFNCVFDYMANGLGVITSGVLSALATAFQTASEANLRGCLSNQCRINRYLAADLNPGKAATQQQSSALLGSVVQPSLPEEMGIVITKGTTLKGQHGRGRVTLPAIPITFTTPATSPDQTNGTAATALNPLLTSLASSLTAAGVLFTPVLVTRPLIGAGVPTRAMLITSWANDVVLGTVRRRKVGRGE